MAEMKLIKQFSFAGASYSGKWHEAISEWLLQDVAHKIDVRDIVSLQYRMEQVGIDLNVTLFPAP